MATSPETGIYEELRRQESNLRPPGYEPGELAAAPRRKWILPYSFTEGKPGPTRRCIMATLGQVRRFLPTPLDSHSECS